jgi:hypothetical protein
MNVEDVMFEELFYEADRSNTPATSQNMVDKIIEHTESEFFSYETEEKSRHSEESALKQKLATLKKSLLQKKNIKNPRLRHLNEERAKQRKLLKSQITEIHIRLQEIEMERADN